MLADGNNAFNQMSQHAIVPVNVVKNQHIYLNFPTLKGTCIDLITTNAVEIFESLNVLPPFCSTHTFQNFQAN